MRSRIELPGIPPWGWGDFKSSPDDGSQEDFDGACSRPPHSLRRGNLLPSLLPSHSSEPCPTGASFLPSSAAVLDKPALGVSRSRTVCQLLVRRQTVRRCMHPLFLGRLIFEAYAAAFRSI